MDKRLAKRHKRQVSRSRQRIRLSEPDVRTPEQIRAAREASRPPDSSSPFVRQSSSQPVKVEDAS